MSQKQQLQELKRIPNKCIQFFRRLNRLVWMCIYKENGSKKKYKKEILFIRRIDIINKQTYIQARKQPIDFRRNGKYHTTVAHRGSVANSTTASMTGTQAPRLDAMYNVIPRNRFIGNGLFVAAQLRPSSGQSSLKSTIYV